MRSFKPVFTAVALTFALLGGTAAMAAEPTTVVLVHGAFADGSSWNRIIPSLEAKGLKVVAVQNPLTSLKDDVAFTQRAIDAAKGDVVLVGHSWGGVVITEAGADPRVKALVYVAAFAPSAGEAVADVIKAYPTPPGLAHPIADAQGFLTLSPETIAKDFAQDLPAEETALISATQGAIQASSFGQPVSAAAWKDKPSWYVLSKQDRMIDPKLQQDMAGKIGAKVTTLDASHVPMLSQPQAVTDVILDAAGSKN